MKKISIIIILCTLMFSGCYGPEEMETDIKAVNGTYPRFYYSQSMDHQDIHNRVIEFPEDYILDPGHLYDLIETENGIDMVFHLVKNNE